MIVTFQLENRTCNPIRAMQAFVQLGESLKVAKAAVESAMSGQPYSYDVPGLHDLGPLKLELVSCGFRVE